jgi:protein involved in polysaccharide export with SLBB domain
MRLSALVAGLMLPVLPGCTMLETSAPTPAQASAPASPQPTALSWLTNWVSQPIEMAPGFDIESIKPALRPPIVAQDDLIEITVWDLYEPGKPYSFPARVSARHTVEVPMLGEVAVESRTLPQIESALVDGLRKGEYLLNPRVLVRSLDAPIIKVQVTGAVNRAGFVELTRGDRSVYAAILSAGNLKKSSGTQVALIRRAEVQAASEIATTSPVADQSLAPAANEPETIAEPNAEPIAELRPQHAPEQSANSVDDISVPPAPPVVRPTGIKQALYRVDDDAGTSDSGLAPARPAASVTARRPVAANGRRQAPSDPVSNGIVSNGTVSNGLASNGRGADGTGAIGEEPTVWYDLALAHDRNQLKLVMLAEGDTVTVKEAAPPLRIDGIVNRPGSYPLPPGRALNAWQAIELAGGVRDDTIPLNITLLRPAGEGRGARRWYLNVVDYQQHPQTSPAMEPGDVLHIEPTTGSRIKRAVGDLWNKP